MVPSIKPILAELRDKAGFWIRLALYDEVGNGLEGAGGHHPPCPRGMLTRHAPERREDRVFASRAPLLEFRPELRAALRLCAASEEAAQRFPSLFR